MTYYECYADESFLKFLGLTSKELAGGHSLGRSFVSRKLRKANNSTGIIDEDPNAPRDSYLNHLFNVKPVYSDDFCFCVGDVQANNRLIVLRPDLETFSIKLARQCKINLGDKKYRLSMESDVLHQFLAPRKNEIKREQFNLFLKDVKDHPTLLKLKELVKY